MRRLPLRRLAIVLAVQVAALALLLAYGISNGYLRAPWQQPQALKGSEPPTGQKLPDLDEVGGLTPAIREIGEGHRALLVLFTCVQCHDEEHVESFLAQLQLEDVPYGFEVEVIAYASKADEEADAALAAAKLGEHEHVTAHFVGGRAASQLKERFHVGEHAIGFLYDSDNTWRATYPLGLLSAEYVAHDARNL